MVEVVKAAKVLKVQGLFLLRSAIAVTIAIALVLFMGVPRAAADDNPLGPNVGTAFLNALGLNPTGGQYDPTLPFAGPSQGADPAKIMNGVMGSVRPRWERWGSVETVRPRARDAPGLRPGRRGACDSAWRDPTRGAVLLGWWHRARAQRWCRL